MNHASRYQPAIKTHHRLRHFVKLLPLWLLCLSALSSMGHEEAIEIGRAASGQLKVANLFDSPAALPRSVFPGINGQATGAIGIHSVILDDPSQDVFQIAPEADCRFILVAKQAGMEVWNDHGSGFMNVGQSFYIGPAPFDTHPVWNITLPTNGIVYSLTLKIHDLNGVYDDSEPFELEFTPIAPAQLTIQDNQDSVIIYIQGTPDADYTLQAATSLAAGGNWTNMATNHADVSGFGFFIQAKRDQPQRFFRCFHE